MINYDSLAIEGNVLKFQRDLEQAKEYLGVVKKVKLLLRQSRNENKIATFKDLISHLENEVFEFKEAVSFGEPKHEVIMEIADISNIADLLAMAIIKSERREDLCQDSIQQRERGLIDT